VKRDREAKIAKLEYDIEGLDMVKIPHPKADLELDVLKHFQGVCRDGKCHE
jgi:hypothetical protein